MLFLQTNLDVSTPHLKPQWQLPFSSGVPPFLRHLRRLRRERASAVSANPKVESVAPSALYPAHFIAWRLEMSFSAIPWLARRSPRTRALPLSRSPPST
jgi:hypothetical protein